MRFLVSSLILLLVAGSACKKPEQGTSQGSAAASRAPTSLKVDKVSSEDGPIKPDKNNDGAVLLTVDGAVSALALISVDPKGNASDGQQWDTVVGDQKINAAWKTAFEAGEGTWQLGVEENGKPMNAKDGSLTPLAAGHHVLTLYASDSGYFDATHQFVVLLERPDHSVGRSNIFKMQ